MSPAPLALISAFCVVGSLTAADVPRAGGQFTTYQESLASQLSTMLQNAQPRSNLVPQGRQEHTERSEVTRNESRAATISNFANASGGARGSSVVAALERMEKLRPRLEPILAVEGAPNDLLAVVLVESGAQPMAMSPRQARGLWQLIPETARQYGLTVNEYRDDRVEIEAATRAALHYLRDLHSHFGNWPLALAAYNAGQKAVDSALSKGRATTFWELRSAGLLPQETRDYVPAVLSAMQLLRAAGSSRTLAPGAETYNWVFAPARQVE